MSDILSSIITPISDSAPFGVNINFDSDFETLKNEINKPGNLDIKLIEESATSLIQNKAKDIRVFCFLSYAFLRNNAWEQLADVFEGLRQLAEKNFDALQPDRERAKYLALKWLAEDKFTSALEDKKPAEAEHSHIVRLLNALATLKPILEHKFPDSPPFPSALIKQAGFWEKACAPKPVEVPSAAVSSLGSTGSSAPSVAVVPADPMDTPKQAQTIARKAALFLIEKEQLKPMGYRLIRSLRWDVLEKVPPNESGATKTQVPGPAAQQRTYFANLLVEQNWKTALEKAEAAFAGSSNHLWLDLQRIIAIAAGNLGEPFAAVHDAVVSETARFVRRLPDIVQCQFADATPFCDEATRQWLQKDVANCGAQSNNHVAQSDTPHGDRFDEEQRAVEALVAAGKIEDAIDLVQNSIRTATNERDSFRRSIAVANLLLRAKQPDIAVSVLEMVDQKAGNYHIDKWEPDLAVEAWSALITAIKAAKAGKSPALLSLLQEKQNTILTKVSYIDPKKALLLMK